MEDLLDETDNLMIIFNPERPHVVMIEDVYDVLIEYFITTEEYEKCAELKVIKEQSLLP